MGEIIHAHVNDIPLAKFLEALHVTEDDDDAELFDRQRRQALDIARPKAVYERFKPETYADHVLINGERFNGEFIAEKLKGQESVIVYAATCGREIHDWASAFTDYFEQYAAETLKQFVLAMAMEALHKKAAGYFDPGKSISTLNPGSLPQLPITEQRSLFAALNTAGDIGVVLTDSCLMVPNKSVSGIMFQTDGQFHNCQHCPRENCPGRRAEFIGMWSM
jgi:cobalamin-dependent methionine synthase I